MKIKMSRKKLVAAGAAALMVVGAGAAYAYWTFGGTGTGDVTTSSTQGVVVHQAVTALTLAPGGQITLHGTITNPNSTDVKVGDLTAVVTGATDAAGAAINADDFTITGGPSAINAVVQKGTALPWSGLTLAYANSAVNQDNGQNAKVSIAYTVTPFVEGGVVVPPVGPALGTSVVVTDPITGAKSLSISINKVTQGSTFQPLPDYVLKAGDILQVMSYHGTVVYTDLVTVDANGVATYVGSPTAAQVGAGSQSLQLAVNSNGVTILSNMMLSGYIAP